MENLVEIIRTEGLLKKMTVNTPFLMDNPRKLWYVDKGSLSIYTVKLENGIEKGKRFFFFDVMEGEILLGLDSRSSRFNLGFLADANEDTVLYELKLTTLKTLFQEHEQLKPAITHLIDNWVNHLFHGISENTNHPNEGINELVRADERLILRKGESISSQKNVLWAKMTLKTSETISINGLSEVQSDYENVIIPITKWSFFKSTRNTGMRFLSTQEALETSEAWDGLRFLDENIFELEFNEIDLVYKSDQLLLEKKYTQQYLKTSQIITETEGIFNRKKNNKYAETLRVESEDSLFNACQVVTSPLNIELSPANEPNSQDPLGDIARNSKIRYREVLLEDNWWKKQSSPMLGFMKESGAPIAIMPSKGSFEAYDPESRVAFKIDGNNVKEVDKLAYTFFKPFPAEKISFSMLLRFAIFKDVNDIYLLVLMALAATMINLVTPVFTGILFDYVIPNADKFQVFHIGFALLAAFAGYILFEITENMVLLRIETKMDIRLQTALWDRILNLPASFFRNYNTGDLAERAMGINEIRKILSGVAITTILASIFSVFNFLLLFYYSAFMAMIALFITFVQVAFIYFIAILQISKEKKMLMYEGKTQGLVLQLLTGVSKFRVTGTEIRAFNEWLTLFNKKKKYAFEAIQIQNIQVVFNSLTPLVSSAILYTFFIQSDIFLHLSTGEFLAFNAAFGAFSGAILAMSIALLSIYQIFPIYERTKPILDTMPEVDTGKSNPGKLRGDIEISQVDFRYDKDTPLILEDISISLDAGDYVAFVGPSGSGKSTIVRLLLGFEKPEAGNLYFDEQELSKLDVRLVRKQIGVVLQDGQLTPGDIFSNIVGSSSQLNVEDAWAAAKLAALDEDIKQMPMGMHTVINEGGSTLSGGQRQRLLIARTLVHKPSIIIFDEATSALDNRTQSVVTESLRKIKATKIVIAHRLSTIQEVDKIFVLDKGKIVQSGTFTELMAVEGLFKELAKRQLE